MSIATNPDSVNASSVESVPACPQCLGERILFAGTATCPWCDSPGFSADPDEGEAGAPPCPDCGSCATFWFRDVVTRDPLVLVCEECAGEGPCECDHDANPVLEPTPLAPREGGHSNG